MARHNTTGVHLSGGVLAVVKGRVLAILLASAAFTAPAADSPFFGTWKLNVAKSRFSPGPPPRYATLEIGPKKWNLDELDGNGRPMKWSGVTGGDRPGPVEGLPGVNLTETYNGRKFTDRWESGGNIAIGKGVISKNGNVMIYRLKGTTRFGSRIDNTYLYERQ